MQDIRNIAIIAHVDHGKTTLVDKMLLAGKLFRDDKAAEVDTYLDNNDLERERGITILSKNVSIRYKGCKINIIDTPGHADFGGEVERVLNMADGCLLLVDAFEGPMPQTRFVLQKAIEMGLKPIVVINKVDKLNCRPSEVQDMVFDLMYSLDASEDQLDFPTIYGSAKQGWMSTDYNQPTEDITPLLDAIVQYIPAPEQLDGTTQMLITSLDFTSYVGRIAVGCIHRGTLREGQDIMLCKRDGTMQKQRIKELNTFEGLGRAKTDHVDAGDICSIIALESGTAYAYALNNLQSRGRFFISPQEEVYAGQVVGEHTKEGDLCVNVCKSKKLTNMRASGSDDKVSLAPPVVFSLEDALEYIPYSPMAIPARIMPTM